MLFMCIVLEAKELHGVSFPSFGVPLPTTKPTVSNFLVHNHDPIGACSLSLSGSISPAITSLTFLRKIDLSNNYFNGTIPQEIGRLFRLQHLDVSMNSLVGGVPATLSSCSQLQNLLMHDNMLTGEIPSNIGFCVALQKIDLSNNSLTGHIPSSLVNFSSLFFLNFAYNELIGEIPPSLANVSSLSILDMTTNKLGGSIPPSIGNLLSLTVLFLNYNQLSGGIPPSLGKLSNLKQLYLSSNNLTGVIPPSLWNISRLSHLIMPYNNLSGSLPPNVGNAFPLLEEIHLSGNQFHGPIPMSLSNASRLEHISIASSFVFLSVLFCLFFLKRKSRKPLNCTSMKEQYVKVSYADLVRATNGFSTDNLIGSGSFSTVYKGLVDGASTQAVAVKVLNLELQGASKSFISECEALRNIRHRNLVKIVTVCSSIHFRGNDFKAVVFEFMDNGSLDDWLHPNESEQRELKKLSLIQRVNIAIDVASALHYLHHHGETPIIHCDMKPSNILLNSNMIAHVGDFGLAKFLKETITKASENSTSSFGLKGTVGYIAPEYGVAHKASIHGDVYSYGIFLLEMFTARRPTDDMFKGGQSLRKFVESAFPDGIRDVMDAHLLVEVYGEASDNAHNINCCRTMECVASMFRIGLLCSSELPTDRMDTGIVINELHEIRDAFTRHETKEESRSRFTEA